MRRFPFVVFLAMALYSVPARGQMTKPEKSDEPADIITIVATRPQKLLLRKLLAVLPETPGGTGQPGNMFAETMKAYRGRYSKVPERVWIEIMVPLKRDFGADRLVDLMAPVYLSRFSDREIRELTAFFTSPIGKKWSRLMPEIQRASFSVGDAFGYLMGEQINKELIVRGYATPAKQ